MHENTLHDDTLHDDARHDDARHDDARGDTSTPATDRGRAPGAEAASPTRRASIVAGGGLVLMAPLAFLGYGVAVSGLVTPDDAARTATDILASETLFRVGITSLLLVIVLDVLVAGALHIVFRPVSQAVSMVAMTFRLVYAAVFTVAVSQLVGALGLLGDGAHRQAFETEQLQAQALLRLEAFAQIWSVGLALFGVHLLLVGYLAVRSRRMPRLIAILVAVAGFGYVFDSIAELLTDGAAPTLAAFTFVGEVLLALWLLARGGRARPREAVSTA